jgi:hypothetical protein
VLAERKQNFGPVPECRWVYGNLTGVKIGFRSLATGSWSLVSGFWLLVTGLWLLVTGLRLLVTGYSIWDFGFHGSLSFAYSFSTSDRVLLHLSAFFNYEDEDKLNPKSEIHNRQNAQLGTRNA